MQVTEIFVPQRMNNFQQLTLKTIKNKDTNKTEPDKQLYNKKLV